MKKEKTFDYENASMRKSYVGYVFDKGEIFVKKTVLKSLPEKWSALHKDGHIHIHDLDAYGITYNCLTFNLLNKFPFKSFDGFDEIRKILGVFDYYKDIIAKIGNEQSGGMAFANFDRDTAEVLVALGVTDSEANRKIIRGCISSLIYYCNNAHERMGQVSYYVTLNIGLADSEFSRFICAACIEEFEQAPYNVFKPNIVYKIIGGVNRFEGDANFDLTKKALLCTAKKMIPTYIFGDSAPNKNVDLTQLSVMGCRTRVVDNLYGAKGSIGRGNIANITINLPRLAFEVLKECSIVSVEERIRRFKEKWTLMADITTDILTDRYQKLLNRSKSDFPTNMERGLWIKDFSSKDNNLEEIFKNGTLSIGFIGLNETVEILTEKKFWQDKKTESLAYAIVEFMRMYCDKQRDYYRLNFSLLATSGELISGRFPKEDKKLYKHKILKKRYYTNSFHIDVDSGISKFDKIAIEGKFHNLCNGGCITYIELGESPLGNDEGLQELVEHAILYGVHYLGFNFPLDICNACGERGVFDICEHCGSDKITHIRRVSGYLEILNYFTSGKKAEVKNRKRN
jgi:ribonucleoside-triphosphate reductase